MRESHIPISRDPSARKTFYPVISGETFRKFCDHIFDETTINFEPENVKRGETIFVGMPYVRYFLDEIMPTIANPIILVTSNGSGTIDERFLPYLKNEKLLKWFGRNITIKHDKICCIPVGFCWFISHKQVQLVDFYLEKLSIKDFFKEKEYHTYYNCFIGTHQSRYPINNYFSTQPFCKISERLPFPTYLEELSQSIFVISPRGINIDCYRTWEALYAGSIPVVESCGIDEIYKDLPVIIVDDLTTVTKQFLDEELEKMKKKTFKLEKLHAKYWLSLLQKAKNETLEQE